MEKLKDTTKFSQLSLEFLNDPFEDIDIESSVTAIKITGEPHEVTKEVDCEMQTFKCFPVEEISDKN